mmetsp:Transcript_107591/g.261198  ORF Transcript_107591/g.261198 Transcript_107591/m.261198 type:complete len:81 (-) Transcript_107591:7-249(-)
MPGCHIIGIDIPRPDFPFVTHLEALTHVSIFCINNWVFYFILFIKEHLHSLSLLISRKLSRLLLPARLLKSILSLHFFFV